MKKIFLLFGVVLIFIVLLGADIRRKKDAAAQLPVPEKKPCYGYTIIEFGKGIDCSGDTVKLTKVKGGQELSRTEQLASY